MVSDERGRVRLDYRIPARGLIGFQSDFMTMTRGTGLMSHVFDEYAPVRPEIAARRNGVLSPPSRGKPSPTRFGNCRSADACSSARATACTRDGNRHSQPDNDLVVNPIKGKQFVYAHPEPTRP